MLNAIGAHKCKFSYSESATIYAMGVLKKLSRQFAELIGYSERAASLQTTLSQRYISHYANLSDPRFRWIPDIAN